MARVYKRDSRGRFASAGGSSSGRQRPPARQVSRERNRLTRDNAGRITSIGGNGATARGGRLRTAAGNLRATQTTRIAGRRQGVVSGKARPRPQAQVTVRGSSAATSRLRPGELMNANARPVNTMARFRKGDNPYIRGTANMKYRISSTNDDKKARLANAQTAKAFFESQGLKVKASSSRASSTIASVNALTKEVSINRSHTSWINPGKSAINQRRSGFVSSSSPMHTVYHELGHARDKNLSNRVGPFGNLWILGTRQGPSTTQRAERATSMQRLARRVSRYATTNPSEFIAETYAGLRTGRRYDAQVMRAYREAQGLSPKPAARRRSRLPKR